MTHALAKFIRMTLLATALLVGFSATAPIADACPNCKDSLAEEGDNELARLGQGYSTSVLFMLGVMGCLVAGFGSAAYFVVKKASAMPLPVAPDSPESSDASGTNKVSALPEESDCPCNHEDHS